MRFRQIACLLSFFLSAMLMCTPVEGSEKLRLKIMVDNAVATGELEDNPLTRQLWEMSPLTLKMEEYGNSEKIAYPPHKLNTSGAKHGLIPQKGDLALFGPWGNLVVFYRKGHASDGLYFLGRITSGLEMLQAQDKDFEAIWEISAPGNADSK